MTAWRLEKLTRSQRESEEEGGEDENVVVVDPTEKIESQIQHVDLGL